MKRIEFVKGQEFLGMRHPVAITSPVDSNVTLVPVTSLPVAINRLEWLATDMVEAGDLSTDLVAVVNAIALLRQERERRRSRRQRARENRRAAKYGQR